MRTDANGPDYEQFKARTIIALNKLGHQRLSSEPGGYSLENWIKGVNLLLDDFEEKMGPVKLPLEFVERRRELSYWLSKPVDLTSIDRSISEFVLSEEEIRKKLQDTRRKSSSRIEELRTEQAARTAELEEEKERLSISVPEQRPSVFRRLFGDNTTHSVDTAESRVEDLESKLRVLSSAMLEEQKSLKSFDQHSSESPWAEEWRRLETLEARRKELEDERLEKLQLVKEREELTASIASLISGISPAKENG